MSILFECPSCGQTYDAGEHLAGKGMRCRSCSAVMRVPRPGEPSRSPAVGPGPAHAPAREGPGRAAKPAPRAAVPPAPPVVRSTLPPMPELPPWDPGDDEDSGDEIPLDLSQEAAPAGPSTPPVGPARPEGGPPEPLKRLSFDTTPAARESPRIPEPRRRKAEVPAPEPEPAERAGAGNARTLKLVAAVLFVVVSLSAVGRVMLGGGGGADEEDATIEMGGPDFGGAAAARPALAPSPRVADVSRGGPSTEKSTPRAGGVDGGGMPDRGAGVEVEPGVVWHRIELNAAGNRLGGPRPASRMTLWLYLPLGSHAPGSLPCILVAPGGGTMLTGADWSTTDEGRGPEHLPFVRAGFAVMGYEIDGALPRDFDQPAFVEGVRRFLAARAGLGNAHVAMEYLASKVPEVDRNRVYAVGHGSAGTTALVVAANEPGIAACVAFAPCVDIKSRYQRATGNADAMIADLERAVPGANALFTRYSPMENLARVPCPVVLFHAKDDPVVPFSDSELAVQIGRPGRVELMAISSGGHDEPMIRGAIEGAIRWLTNHGANPVPTAAGAAPVDTPATPAAPAPGAPSDAVPF